VTTPRGNPKWRISAPKLWRICGTARDGLVVTLGKYETEREAQSDLEKLTKSGDYRNLTLELLPPPPPPAPPEQA
jgi:hypothetical protein